MTWAVLLAVLVPGASARTEDDEPDETPFVPGLVAVYRGAPGVQVARIEASVVLGDAAGRDPRLPRGPNSAQWRGRLLVQSRGAYRLSAYGAGRVRIELAGEVVLDAASETPQWHHGRAIELAFGRHRIEINYERGRGDPQLAVFWQGPDFALEPISAQWLLHDQDESPELMFDHGQQLAHALRCTACHHTERSTPLAAPALDRVAGNLSRDWLIDWLTRQPVARGPAARRMPHFALSGEEAEAIAAYLFSSNKHDREALGSDQAEAAVKRPDAGPTGGERLFHSLGCIACHTMDGLGRGGWFGGGDLTAIGHKRPLDYFARWLAQPESINRHHRMPKFDLTENERSALADYLAGRPDDSRRPESDPSPSGGSQPDTARHDKPHQSRPDDAPVDAARDNAAPADAALNDRASADAARTARGRELFQSRRCSVCHAGPDNEHPVQVDRSRLHDTARWDAACLGEPARDGAHPGYALGADARTALRAYFSDLARSATDVAPDGADRPDAPLLLAEHNCLSCHARDGRQGLADLLLLVAERHEEVAAHLSLLTPPSLESVGDKLQDGALETAIAGGVRRRAWLEVQMPRFALNASQRRALADYFIAVDRVPDRADDRPVDADLPGGIAVAGARLVTSDGFGCTSCHDVGGVAPGDVAPNARGPELAGLSQRIRRSWFDRWVRDPSRIVAGMEMPSVQTPVRGVLDEHLGHQLAAVWHVLNEPEFKPPLPGALRTVRAANLPQLHEPAQALTDVLRVGEQTYVKPLLIALSNRHNVLYDLEAGGLAGWWIGDAARQRTSGKAWFWEAAGVDVFPAARLDQSDVQLLIDGQPLAVGRQGQFVTEFDRLEYAGQGLRWTQRMLFERPPAAGEQGPPEPRRYVLRMVQTFEPLRADGQDATASGFRRRIQFEPLGTLPPNCALRVALHPGASELRDLPLGASPGAPVAALRGSRGDGIVRLAGGTGARLTREEGRVWARWEVAEDARPSLGCELEYTTRLPVDRHVAPHPQPDDRKPNEVDAVPGWEGARLPLGDSMMPTALAWRPDGTLVVASLEGRVWLCRDTTGDGVPDRADPLGPELPAPYGLAVDGEAIDVLCKFALLRLRDASGDGRTVCVERLASGWGHTADYHDWAVGLVRDAAGCYYALLPCEQDNRPREAAHLRGRGVRLRPRSATPDDPSRYRVEEFCSGLRFPMGLAISRRGHLFATDNQGNYKAFNELNHLVEGGFYGFINSTERRRSDWPARTLPAVEIPHPWTRSVNGICFLDTPPALRERLGRDRFGPFEGHLVGCEYDTRRLVRMSLDQVDGVYQGAVYPFSADAAQGGPAGHDAAGRQSEGLQGPISCAVSPDGDLYIGNLRDSGWGGGNNVGSIVRLRPPDRMPPGIAEVRAVPRGLKITFTAPLDPARLRRVEAYDLWSYRRINTPAYGGPDQDQRKERIEAIEVDADGRGATLVLAGLRAGFVYQLRLRDLGVVLQPDEVHYTMRRVPR